MAQYTVLTDADLEAIAKHYKLEKIVSYKVLTGGSENTNYFINTKNKAFVLTICEQKSKEEALDLASLLEYLKSNNFVTSKVVKSISGELVITWNKKSIMLKEFLEGDIVQDLSENTLKYLGKELAKLHQINAPKYLQETVSYGIDRFDEVKHYAPDSSFYTWLKNAQSYIEKYLDVDLPKALIHSDIFYNNIIVDKEHATIMDFEEACYYYRVFDIGMMIVGTCVEKNTLNLSKVTHLLKGYQQEITFLEIERKALKAFTVYAAVATSFWRHQNFNHVNVIPEMKNHYVEMKQIADAIMNLPKDALFSVSLQ